MSAGRLGKPAGLPGTEEDVGEVRPVLLPSAAHGGHRAPSHPPRSPFLESEGEFRPRCLETSLQALGMCSLH